MVEGGRANRYLVLAAAAVASLISGFAYTWSIFQKPLMELRGWESSEVSLAYSISFVCVLVGILTNGFVRRKLEARHILLIAGLLRGVGFFMTGFAQTIPQLYFAFSIVSGLGGGYLYSTAVSVATSWFPDKKGFANGLCLGCTGLAPLFFAPLGNALIESFGVLASFRILGACIIVAMACASLFIATPEPGWLPQGYEPANAEEGERKPDARRSGINVVGKSRSPVQVLKTPAFWALWPMTACACTSGMMMTGQAAFIAQELVGVTAAQGALQVGLLAVFSFLGRFAFGSLSDKVGRLNLQAALLAVTAVDMLFFFGGAHDFVSFMAVMGVVGMCFGGAIAMLPAMASDAFGMRDFEFNYGLVFSGHTLASFAGPLLASGAYQATGAFDAAFHIAGYVALAGFLFALAAKLLIARMNERDRELSESSAE